MGFVSSVNARKRSTKLALVYPKLLCHRQVVPGTGSTRQGLQCIPSSSAAILPSMTVAESSDTQALASSDSVTDAELARNIALGLYGEAMI